MLPDELLEEIFLRLPPDEPASLVRASLASNLWLGRLTAPRFQARYSEFHGAAPMLGFFFYSCHYVDKEPPFVSTTKFRARIPEPGNRGYSAYDVWDCRHGRLLLGCSDVPPKDLAVLDPITGCRTELDAPDWYNCFGAAVLCAVNGCDHRAYHGGLSRVVFVGLEIDNVAYAYESLPETGEWSKPSSGLYLGPDASIELGPPVLVKDTLYFKLVYDHDDHVGILKYEFCSKCLSVIDAPIATAHTTILIGMEDGTLGFAHLDVLTLNLWSRQIGSDGVGSWTECRVIDLKELLPVPKKIPRPIGSMEGGDTIFVNMDLSIYMINLKSLEWKRIWKKGKFNALLPYMSFYYPQAQEAGEGRAVPVAPSGNHGTGTFQKVPKEPAKEEDGPLAELQKWFREMRPWLVAVAAVWAWTAFRLGRNPPAGFWRDDNGHHHAGDPVLRDFYYLNATPFVTSLVIMVLLMSERFFYHGEAWVVAVMLAVFVDFGSLVGAYIAATADYASSSVYIIVIACVTCVCACVIYLARLKCCRRPC